jgi:hypothetical protein
MLGSNNSAISGASAGELQATEEPSDSYGTVVTGLGGRKPHRAGRDDLLRRAGGATDDVHCTTRRGLPARGYGN